MEKNNDWSMLITFINKVWPFNDNIELKSSTRLSKDLGIGGDDADELMYEFSKAFNINIESLTLSKYFEGYPESTLFTNVFSKKDSLKEKEITLGDLEYALKIGELTDTQLCFKDANI